MKERITWIDVCRGIGILLVIYGHGLDGKSYRYLIYAFHMPLFFFLSGIVFQYKKNAHFLPTLQKNIKAILVPYYSYAAVSLLLWYMTVSLTTQNDIDITRPVFGIFYGNGNENYLFFNVVLWFLPCLFITRMLFLLITRFTQNRFSIASLLILLSIAGYLFSFHYPAVKLPFGIETALNAVVFFGAGYLWNSYYQSVKPFLQRYAVILACIATAVFLALAHYHYVRAGSQIDMRVNRLHEYSYFYLAAFTGIIASIAISFTIKTNRILEYIGKRSLILFVWHLVVFTYLSKILFLFIDPSAVPKIRNLYLAPAYTIISILVILLLHFIITQIKARFEKTQG